MHLPILRLVMVSHRGSMPWGFFGVVPGSEAGAFCDIVETEKRRTHLEVEQSQKCPYDEKFYQSDSEEDIGDFASIHDMVTEICDTDQDKDWWSLHLQNSCGWAWLAVLLTRLTHLQSLSISHIKEGFLLDVLVKAAKRQHPFDKSTPFPFFRDVELTCPLENEMIWSDHAMPFFYLPAVRKVNALKVYEGSPGSYTKPDFADHRRSECPVTEINLIHTIACDDINDWIAACSKLEHFHLEFGMINSIKHTEGYNPLTAQAFRRSLLSAKYTPKSLRLEFRVSYKTYSKHHAEQSKMNLPFGSFKEFHVLENLFMRHANLIRSPNTGPMKEYSPDHELLIQILPRSLKSLEIVDIMDNTFPALVWDLVKLVTRREDMPQLRSIVLHVNDGDSAINKGLIGVIECACQSTEVCLTIKGSAPINN
ncbi:hypothetical protein BO94DRAFT_581477 [Aspergillus sclerotioniger CBS 115572]|uniref:Leucine-rich repeat domain-containing protein n=1 Tax=Aspergillus sclerotioniger CBS 115572 TaxID=1450535 RepID=A0A317XBZ7_9EURO|nr:hypothetical protein BO94DRAFT_581477 [Aspergillus sclerotioniger CBS 115572]PWY95137.1 hypothetical protein BO94DRAFT_581477 [Aspergillus sclerotioniger CBS 115572]